MTLKFDGWPWKKTRAPLLYYFKLCASFHSHWSIPTGVTVRKHQVRVKIAHYLSYVSLKFDGWPWKTIGHLSYATSSFVHHFIAIGQFKLELRQIRVKIGHFLSHMTLGHGSFQAGVTVRKHQIRVEIGDFMPPVTLKFDRWPWKTIGHLFYAGSSCVHDFIAICEFKLELQSRNGYVGCWPLWPWPLTLTFCMDIISVHGNNSWTFHDDMMMGT